MSGPLIDPDCRDGKHRSCAGGPCECPCHGSGSAVTPLRARVAVALAGLAALTVAVCGVAGAANASALWPQHKTWTTCDPRTHITRADGTRIYDDHFTEPDGKTMPGPDCIRSDGDNFTDLTNAVPYGGDVVEANAIQFGDYYGYDTPNSNMPEPVSQDSNLTLHVRCSGNAPGVWTCDAVDAWFSSSLATANRHGTYELVITTREWYGGNDRGNLILSGHHWYATEWTTCPRGLDMCWPLIRFVESRQDGLTQRLHMSAFTDYAISMGWLPDNCWINSANPMLEVWFGGKGMIVAAQLGTPRYAVIKAPPKGDGK
jgi:hypothetical protein